MLFFLDSHTKMQRLNTAASHASYSASVVLDHSSFTEHLDL